MRSREEAFERTRGLFNIAVTPFDTRGEIDFGALTQNIARVTDLGYDGLLIGGTYGEFATMSLEERSALFRAVMDRVGDSVPVLLCTAHSDVRATIELTTLASELGGLPMLTAPYVSELADDHIEWFFAKVAPLSGTGIMIYNAPAIGITLSPPLICRLARIEGVVALKQGDLTPASVDMLAGRLYGKVRLLAASDLALLGPLALGFDGVSSTNSCALPELIQAIYRAITAGDVREAGRLQRLWYPLRELARRFGQPQTTKAIMDLRGWFGGPLRPPLQALNEAQRAEVQVVLDALNLPTG